MLISNLFSKLYIFIFCCISTLLFYQFIVGKLNINQCIKLLLILIIVTLIFEYSIVCSVFPGSLFDNYGEFENRHSNEIILINTSQNKVIHGMLVNKYKIPSYDDNIILFSHGNACSISSVYYSDIVRQLSNFGSVFIYDYRGYGKDRSFPSEEKCYEDILSVWYYLTDIKKVLYSKITVVGHSLGCAISSKLVAMLSTKKNNENNEENDIKSNEEDDKDIKSNEENNKNENLPNSLILICPFVNLSEMCYEVFFPLYFIYQGLDNLENLKIINNKIPVLVLHNVSDNVIPYYHGIKLSQITNCEFTLIKGSHVSPVLNDKVRDFIQNKAKIIDQKFENSIWSSIEGQFISRINLEKQ